MFVSLLVFHFSLSVYAKQPESWEEIGNELGNSNRCVQDGVATIQGFECIFINIVRILTPIAGLAVFIMFIIGSFQLITAGGETKQIQKARKTITFAVLGLVLFVGIWFILLLIKAITGVDVTKFEIPGP
ncbi:MAG: hypothetical protein ACPLY7_01280 [Microgenomates group bacterium]